MKTLKTTAILIMGTTAVQGWSCCFRIKPNGWFCRPPYMNPFIQRYCAWRAQPITVARLWSSCVRGNENADLSLPELELHADSHRYPFFPIYYNDVYEVKLPPNHRFPMEKYGRVRRLVQKWIQEHQQEKQEQQQSQITAANNDDRTERASAISAPRPLIRCEFRVSPLVTVDELITTHSPTYVERFIQGHTTEREQRNVGFPWSTAGVKRALSSVGGTVAAACAVCQEKRNNINLFQQQQQPEQQKGQSESNDSIPYSSLPLLWAAHVAGGTHHAFWDYGEGFCVFSDIAVAANVVLQRYPDQVQRILILDLDVHQGNGNAVLFQNSHSVFTFSMHCEANYFSPKQTSDLDIELPVNCDDKTYLMTLQHWLKRIQREAGQYDLIFYQAGVDILHHDRLGRMNLTPWGVQQRNAQVFDFARAMQAPLVITMGGGYPRNNDWTPILEAHANVYYQAYQYLCS